MFCNEVVLKGFCGDLLESKSKEEFAVVFTLEVVKEDDVAIVGVVVVMVYGSFNVLEGNFATSKVVKKGFVVEFFEFKFELKFVFEFFKDMLLL